MGIAYMFFIVYFLFVFLIPFKSKQKTCDSEHGGEQSALLGGKVAIKAITKRRRPLKRLVSRPASSISSSCKKRCHEYTNIVTIFCHQLVSERKFIKGGKL